MQQVTEQTNTNRVGQRRQAFFSSEKGLKNETNAKHANRYLSCWVPQVSKHTTRLQLSNDSFQRPKHLWVSGSLCAAAEIVVLQFFKSAAWNAWLSPLRKEEHDLLVASAGRGAAGGRCATGAAPQAPRHRRRATEGAPEAPRGVAGAGDFCHKHHKLLGTAEWRFCCLRFLSPLVGLHSD